MTICACGNAPSVDPRWNLACCFECGAVYTNLVFPASWELVERVLLSRARMSERNSLPGETLSSLSAENEAHGDDVPAFVEVVS